MSSKKKYYFKKILRTIITVIGVTIIAFLIMHLAPGDPAKIMLGNYATQENIEALRIKLNLDKPLYIQYYTWINNVIHGDFGTSIRYDKPVIELIGNRIGITLKLTISALMISLIGGVLMGILGALKQNTWVDYFSTIQAMFWISVPSFWLGIIFLYVFGLKLRWFPIAGMAGLSSLVLPALSMGLRQEAWFARPMRSEMLEVLNEEYIRAAKAKGLKRYVVVFKHGLRNALIPIITMLALRLPWIIGGSVVIEKVFSFGGIGTLLINSVFARDYPVVQSLLLIISITVVIANFVADIVYSLVDPRIRLGE